MRCYAPDPAGRANSAPPDLLVGFGGKERKGKWKGKGRERKGERERNGKENEVKGKRMGGMEGQRLGREEEGRG